MIKRFLLRIAITARQNRTAIGVAAAWVVVNGVIFATVLGRSLQEAVLVALCLHRIEGSWGRLYASFTELVVFGAVASLVVADATRRYRPEATCSALAERARDHLIVIGYTNLGIRIRAMAAAAGATVVVVDDDRARVDALIRAEEPLVLGSAREPATLRAAAVARARVVVIASDDLEVAVVASNLVRAANPGCKLVVRCSDDEIGEILAKAYSARVLSTSRIAARFILGRAQKAGVRRAVVIGQNTVGRRVTGVLEGERIEVGLIPATEDPAAFERAGVRGADLIVLADDDLGKNLVRVDRLRALNPDALVMCRVFHDDSAELLTRRPFRAVVLSTSRLAAELLAAEGVLRDVGVVAPGSNGKPIVPRARTERAVAQATPEPEGTPLVRAG
jgi:Trk K+ transport system NAD-binding subunit